MGSVWGNAPAEGWAQAVEAGGVGVGVVGWGKFGNPLVKLGASQVWTMCKQYGLYIQCKSYDGNIFTAYF